MQSPFTLPPAGFGPGSQSTDEALEYIALPSGMRTYVPHMPEIEDPDSLAPALAVLDQVAQACDLVAREGGRAQIALAGLAAPARRLLAETLGHGEVSMRLRGVPAVAVQESVFAGVWVLQGADIDLIEVAPVPELAVTRAHQPHRATTPDAPRAPGVVNAPALLAELGDKSASYRPGAEIHVVNLTLLPHTPEDLDHMARVLGEGAVTILSRGYGNCRITASAMPHVWRVQFFNSSDTLILDTWEVTQMPEVAIAGPEDIADSADRIREVRRAMA
ncbi:hydrogenase expression/formation protein [Natronohydrobacter thiooxidans]|jgi:hydrogenase-1 operon protein HyaF|uniref:hydrogenase expression/formation protein n=1 Tax=Natronohydrobacter thiooxidans TaxID=87172 RepID=UPI0008FF0F12|nr:hydrogenase expression/formation protein [Natronohydrobacter thiooxidans]